MKTKYVVKRLENMALDDERRQMIADSGLPVDVPCLTTTKVSGPMTKAEAQRMGEQIADEGGDATIHDATTGRQVASVHGGDLFLPQYEYGEKGSKYPIDYENCFWTGDRK